MKKWTALLVALSLLVGIAGAAMAKTEKITITATGDITLGADPRRPASSPASEVFYDRIYTQSGGAFLKNMNFDGANEVTLINLEGCLTTARKHASKSIILRGKPAYAKMLARAGVDVVGHANNHANDFYSAGIKDTRSAVNQYDMRYAGNGVIARVTRSGVNVGFCAFNTFTGGTAKAMKKAVKQLRKTCQIIVVSFHWGKEYITKASATQRSLGRMAVTAGADLVVGHHSHVVGGIEKYKGKYIVYGLGTLSSIVKTPVDMDTFIFRQTFEVDTDSGAVEEGQVKLLPLSMSSSAKLNNGMPTQLTGAGRKRVLNKIRDRSSSFVQTLPKEAFE